ncbi:MAG: hypothetical protein WDM77_20510 [Steroidobacteraceae bacterium]
MSIRAVVAATSLVLGMQAMGGSALAAAPSAGSGPPAAFPKSHYSALNKLPDWGGVWTFNFRPAPGVKRELPQLKGKYLESYQAWQKIADANHGEVPRNGSYCRPPGMPGIMMVGQYPTEFLFTPGRVTTHHEAWMQLRSIWTDGRKHPEDWDPTFYGHSIGHWEGSTLVVDTVGIKTVTELRNGMPHSDQLHIVEHIHLALDDPNSLIDDMLVEDPLALATPWHNVLSFTRARDQDLLEFVCAENDRNPVDAAGHTGLQ